MKSILRAVTIAAVAAILAPALVHAAEPEKVVVRNRKYATDGKFEASANVGMTLVNYLTEHTSLSGSLAYNISEQFSVEVGGGYAFSGTTTVAKAVADSRAQDTNKNNFVDDFSDLWRMKWNTTAALRWAPLYGKMNVAAELPVHFKFYVLAGAGYGGFERDSIIYCAAKGALSNPAAATCDPSQSVGGNNMFAQHQEANKMVGVAGVGLRFFTNEWSALQVELRDVVFKDSYRTSIQLDKAHTDAPIITGADPKYGNEAKSPGLTHLPFLQIGATFTF